MKSPLQTSTVVGVCQGDFLWKFILMNSIELGIVGASGTMGSALVQRCETVGLSARGITRDTVSYEEDVVNAEILLLCMKQRDTIEWLDHHGQGLRDGQIILSLAALLSVDVLRRHCNNDQIRIGRFMTTTGIADSAQEIVWTSDGFFDQDQLQKVDSLLSQLGETKYLGVAQDEALERRTFRACVVGWIADSCSVHVDGLMEVLGFTSKEAHEAVDNALSVLARQRAYGLDYGECRDQVMSKGGITEAGVKARSEQVYNGIEMGLLAAVSQAETISALYSK